LEIGWRENYTAVREIKTLKHRGTEEAEADRVIAMIAVIGKSKCSPRRRGDAENSLSLQSQKWLKSAPIEAEFLNSTPIWDQLG
jgi:hypothetical protein